jgi:hypothetical protein
VGTIRTIELSRRAGDAANSSGFFEAPNVRLVGGSKLSSCVHNDQQIPAGVVSQKRVHDVDARREGQLIRPKLRYRRYDDVVRFEISERCAGNAKKIPAPVLPADQSAVPAYEGDSGRLVLKKSQDFTVIV